MTFSKTDGDHAAEVQAVEDGWVAAMGVQFVRATSEEVIAELEIGQQHRQPLGIVHGGVYAGLIETVTSIGAALHAAKYDLLAVGMENHSSFVHAVRAGKLTATATPVSTGRRTQLWEATIRDDTGRIAATGRVRLFLVAPGAQLAGEGAELKR
jgi:uncharacterized protein (TIGR00369 family)